MGILAVLAAGSEPAAAQRVEGQIIDSTTGQPVGRGFVVLLDGNDRELVRTLTDRNGRFAIPLTTPVAGPLRLRSERIGYRLFLSEPLSFAADSPSPVTLHVVPLPVQLAAIEVEEENECRIRPEEGQRTALVWEEARKALAAAAWTASQELYRFRSTRYERSLDTRRRRVTAERTSMSSGVYETPFRSRPPELLARDGYIVAEGSDHWYYAPDAEVLQSETFLNTHCFRVVRDDKARRGMVGLAFRPIPGRRVADVNGVLWLDEESSELRAVDYRYTDDPWDLNDGAIGGTVEFMPIPSGAWIVNRWEIRMPQLGARRRQDAQPRDVEIVGFHDAGGEVIEISTLEGELMFEAELAHVTGTVIDSARVVPAPLRNAVVNIVGTVYADTTDWRGEYTISAPLNAEYGLSFSHPRVDSMAYVPPPEYVTLRRGTVDTVALRVPPIEEVLADACRGEKLRSEERVIVGVVRDGETGAPFAGAQVYGAWQSIRAPSGRIDAMVRAQDRQATAVTDSLGYYALCGLEFERPVYIHAVRGNKASPSQRVLFSYVGVEVDGVGVFDAPDPLWRLDLNLFSGVDMTVAVSGAVVDAVTGAPLSDAEVLLGTGADTAVTDSLGRFELRRVRRGEARLTVRRLGYQPQDVSIPVDGRQTTYELALPIPLLPAATALDPIAVDAEASTRRGLTDFHERRAQGVGSFITRQEFTEQGDPINVTAVLGRMAGIRVLPNTQYYSQGGPRWFLRTSRGRNSRSFAGNQGEACSPLVYRDRLYVGKSDDLDLDIMMSIEDIEAIEVHWSAASIPLEFRRGGFECGVIAFWTR